MTASKHVSLGDKSAISLVLGIERLWHCTPPLVPTKAMQRTSSTLAPGEDGNGEAGTCSTYAASPTHATGLDEAVTCITNVVSPTRVPSFLPTDVDTTRMSPGNAFPHHFMFDDSPQLSHSQPTTSIAHSQQDDEVAATPAAFDNHGQ
ncbi:hypothetical protein V6N13_108236 [Hibiscus sabdariffa]|uniref:Uncharacterized protein n=1 Tax=Hibiscus sabdariffa TaxID=183260 RepID=A0ABR2SRN6_9ROSI